MAQGRPWLGTDEAALFGCMVRKPAGLEGPDAGPSTTCPAGNTGFRSAPAEAVPRPPSVSHAVQEAGCPPAQKSARGMLAPAFPLELPAFPSSLLKLIPHMAIQQTRGLARTPPALGQRRAAQGGMFPGRSSFKEQGRCRGPQPRPAGPQQPPISGCSSPATLALCLASAQCPAKPGSATTEEHREARGRRTRRRPAGSSGQCRQAARAPHGSGQSQTVFWVLLHPDGSLPHPSLFGCDLGLSDCP